ncbi:hypothetical protein [Occultella kanbiaonis]|uniref:hypothetical protein n=1 Tax=Occultella kanbiaonis TaxID=2675754 RepID=UPI001A995667|nr:hypothetical protein [Occultella kanbiaonis]
MWPGRHWEWAALRFENGDFDRPDILSSLYDLTDLAEGSVDLHFGPTAPEGDEARWVQT